MVCTPNKILNKSPRVETVLYEVASTEDIMSAIIHADGYADSYINPAAVQCLRGRTDLDTLRNVWSFVRDNVRYRSDRPRLERVKSPGALFEMGQGDCKSFSISAAAILRALGYKSVWYRFTAYNGGDFTHVYIVVKVNGKYIPLDATIRRFNYEVPYKRHKDIPATGGNNKIAIGQAPAAVGADLGFLLNIGVLAGAYFIYKLLSK